MDIEELTLQMKNFVNSKGWNEPGSNRPQTQRNLAISLVIEAGEVLELFQWKDTVDTDELKSELADVSLYLLQLASVSGINLEKAIVEKLAENNSRTWDQD